MFGNWWQARSILSVALLTVVCGLAQFSPIALAAAGDLDATFNATGKVTTAFGFGGIATSLAIQPDGKIVAGGYSGGFALARYDNVGNLDTTFNSTGKVTTAIGSSDAKAYSVVVQPNGKIVAAGVSPLNGRSVFALARYNGDGSLDTTFNGTGTVTTAIGLTDDRGAFSVALQPDGKIVVAGTSVNNVQYLFALSRYNPNGTLDTTFNGTGKVTTAIRGSDDEARSLVVQPDGRIVAAGYTFTATGYRIALVRYNGDGSLDTSFNTTGVVETAVSEASSDVAYAVALQQDGKIVVAGNSNNGSQHLFALARYASNGSLDTTFNGTGKVTTTVGPFSDNRANSVAVQTDGKIVAAGYSGFLFALTRHNQDGSLDTDFNHTGKVTTAIGVEDVAYAVAIQPDGKIVAAGSSVNALTDFALARYLGAQTNSALPVANAIEYYHAAFGHYFVTAIADEISKLDAGVFMGWARTGQAFNVYTDTGTGLVPVCRFFTIAFPPTSSHFYAPRGLGCEPTFANVDWQFEGDVFYSPLPDTNGNCPTGTAPVYRLYNNGQGGAPNHRFTTSQAIRTQMLDRGYIAEGSGIGVGMCSPI